MAKGPPWGAQEVGERVVPVWQRPAQRGGASKYLFLRWFHERRFRGQPREDADIQRTFDPRCTDALMAKHSPPS